MGSPSSGTPFLVRCTFPVPPLGSTGISRFVATMGESDLRPEPRGGLCLPRRRSAQRSLPKGESACRLRRLSQVPRPFCRCAPLPITPGRPARARARCFRADVRFRHLRQVDHDQWCNEAESDLLALRLTPLPSQASTVKPPLGQLHVERAITWRGPFTPRERPGLSWRTEEHEGTRMKGQKAGSRFFARFIRSR